MSKSHKAGAAVFDDSASGICVTVKSLELLAREVLPRYPQNPPTRNSYQPRRR